MPFGTQMNILILKAMVQMKAGDCGTRGGHKERSYAKRIPFNFDEARY
jgi:hypothetical protein